MRIFLVFWHGIHYNIKMERRRFLHGSLGVGLGLVTVGPEGMLQAKHDFRSKAKVVIARDTGSMVGEELVQEQVTAMLDRSITAVTGEADPTTAWRKIIVGSDRSRLKTARVAIKVNALAGKRMSTQPVLAMAVARKLLDAGVRGGNVLVWDRSDRELTKAGYH